MKTKEYLYSTFFFEFTKTDNVGRIRNIFRELIFYVVFVMIATIVISSNISNFWFTHVMKTEFIDDEFDTMYPLPVTMLEIRNLEETWKAIENVLFESVYWDYWYQRPNSTKLERMKLYIMGMPRLRQLRVKKVRCTYSEVRRSHEYCYPSLSKSTMDKEPYGLKNQSAWLYSSEKKLGGVSYNGLLQSYEGGGYYQDFIPNERENWKTFCKLKDDLWIDRQTRAIFIDFTIYNANINVFLIIKIAFELPATGGVVVSYRLHNVKILTLVNKYDFFILGLELICFLYLFYYTACLYFNVKLHKANFFLSRWNRLDTFLIFLGYIYMFICIHSSILTSQTLSKVIKNPNSHVNFEKVGYCFGHMDIILAVLMLLIYVKLFKYVELSRTLGLINATMRKAVKDLAAFIVVFFIVFLTFAILGYHLFGSHIHGFSTVAISIFTLVKSLGGEFNYFELQEYYRYVAPIYFISFIFIVFFVLLNMFLGIISDAYATMKCDITVEENYDIPNFLNRGGRRFFKNCPEIANKFKIVEVPERLPIIRGLLAEALYGKPEIDLFFANYDVTKDISETEKNEFKEELKLFQYELYESIDYVKMIESILTYISEENIKLYEQALATLESNIAILNSLVLQLYNRITRAQKLEEKLKANEAAKANSENTETKTATESKTNISADDDDVSTTDNIIGQYRQVKESEKEKSVNEDQNEKTKK